MSSSYSEGTIVTDNPPLASLGSRLLGQLIDWVITVAIVFAGAIGGGDAAAVSFFAIGIAYYLLCDGLPNGQSLGKRMLGIRVIHANSGKPCNYFQSFLRNIAQVLGVLDWIWIFGSKQRRAGDLLARTLVVTA